MVSDRPCAQPGRMVPPYRNAAGTSSRAHAISMPGSDLSQPAMATSASNCSACTITSTESAITSRLTSEDFMPSVPIEIPSDTAIVPNSNGTAPACRTPSFAAAASPLRCRLHGVTSFQDEATATCGRSMSASLSPTARSIARAGARDGPVVSGPERGRGSLLVIGRPPVNRLGRKDKNQEERIPRGSSAGPGAQRPAPVNETPGGQPGTPCSAHPTPSGKSSWLGRRAGRGELGAGQRLRPGPQQAVDDPVSQSLPGRGDDVLRNADGCPLAVVIC